MSLENAKKIISILNNNGHSAYLVGGCVRDLLLNCQPKDYDIATSALPSEVARCLSDFRIAEVGLQHGTVGAVIDHEMYEITTFRTESGYSDFRRPDSVTFVSSIYADLARRDFTVNAIAMTTEGELIDPYGGRNDIKCQIIRCVGDPELRFMEDSLRILRGLRFFSRLGFEIEEKTSQAMFKNAHLLSKISNERIRDELLGILSGKNVLTVLDRYKEIIFTVIPELAPLVGFCQHNPWHIYDIYNHTIHAVAACPDNPIIRVAALFHDIAKPQCFFTDEKGIGHFFGHAEKSADMASPILHRLKFKGADTVKILTLIRHHYGDTEPTAKAVKRKISKVGKDNFLDLMLLCMADDSAKNPALAEKVLKNNQRVFDLGKEILEKGDCIELNDLDIRGSDIIALGIPAGKEVGRLLNQLLSAVVEGETDNQKDCLIGLAQKLISEGE